MKMFEMPLKNIVHITLDLLRTIPNEVIILLPTFARKYSERRVTFVPVILPPLLRPLGNNRC